MSKYVISIASEKISINPATMIEMSRIPLRI
jgi:hypothetical protein